MSRTFESLSIRNYRYFFFGGLLSNTGSWIQRIAQDWLVLTQLTDNSSSVLGVVTALQFLGFPLFATYAGGIADRFSKRKVLLVAQVFLGFNAIVMWALVATGVVELWHVYVLAFTQGVVAAFDGPARQAFVSEMVGVEHVVNAVGLNATSFNGARLLGPAVSGFLISAFHDDVAPALLVNAFTYAAMIIALLAMNPSELKPVPRAARKGAARGGIAYVAAHKDIVVLLSITFMLATFGLNFQIYNATMATEVFGRGAQDFGILGTIQAVGTLVAALMAARRAVPRLRTIMISLFVFSVVTYFLAAASSFAVYALWLLPSGFTAITVMITANAAVQLSSDPEYRGRVMSIYMAINLGGTPLGAPIIGWVGDQFGPRATLLVGASATLLCFVAIMGYFFARNGMRLVVERTGRWPRLEATWKNDGRWGMGGAPSA